MAFVLSKWNQQKVEGYWSLQGGPQTKGRFGISQPLFVLHMDLSGTWRKVFLVFHQHALIRDYFGVTISQDTYSSVETLLQSHEIAIFELSKQQEKFQQQRQVVPERDTSHKEDRKA